MIPLVMMRLLDMIELYQGSIGMGGTGLRIIFLQNYPFSLQLPSIPQVKMQQLTVSNGQRSIRRNICICREMWKLEESFRENAPKFTFLLKFRLKSKMLPFDDDGFHRSW